MRVRPTVVRWFITRETSSAYDSRTWKIGTFGPRSTAAPVSPPKMKLSYFAATGTMAAPMPVPMVPNKQTTRSVPSSFSALAAAFSGM
ncbi:hypothetical protein D9M70_590040 [compost metagenome]